MSDEEAAVAKQVGVTKSDDKGDVAEHASNDGAIDTLQQFLAMPPDEWCVGVLCNWVLDTTGSTLIARMFNLVVSVPLKLVVVAMLAYVINWVLRKVFSRVVHRLSKSLQAKVEDTPAQAQRAKRRMQSLQSVGISVVSTIVYTVALIFALELTGFNVMPLLASVGIVGLAVGFGARKLVEDLFAGLAMLIEDQFAVGDRVDVGVAEGTVEHISLRSVVLRDSNGVLWHVSNSEIAKVGNESQIWARALVKLVVNPGVKVKDFLDQVERIATEVANRDEWQEYVVATPKIYGVQEFSVDSMTVSIGVRIRPRRRRQFERDLRTELIAQLQDTNAFQFVSTIHQS